MDLSMTTPISYLTIDFGGTFAKATVVDERGKIYADSLTLRPSRSEGTSEEILGALQAVVADGLAYCAHRGLSCAGIGISIPGPFDYQRGISWMKHKFQGIEGMNLKRVLQAQTGLPVCFMHDVNAVLAGELAFGEAKDYANVAVITLGTGLGFSFSQEGAIQTNAMGSPVAPIYNLPYGTGILEDYVSKRGFLRRYRELGGCDDPTLTVAKIGERATRGEAIARQTYRDVAQVLRACLQPILTEKGIECLLFGGQIAKSFAWMRSAIEPLLTTVPTLRQITVVRDIDRAAVLGIFHGLQRQSEIMYV